MGSLNFDLDEKRNHQGHYANTQNINTTTTHAYCFNRLKLYVKINFHEEQRSITFFFLSKITILVIISW